MSEQTLAEKKRPDGTVARAAGTKMLVATFKTFGGVMRTFGGFGNQEVDAFLSKLRSIAPGSVGELTAEVDFDRDGELTTTLKDFAPAVIEPPPPPRVSAPRVPAGAAGFVRLGVMSLIALAGVLTAGFASLASAVPYKVQATNSVFDGRTIDLELMSGASDVSGVLVVESGQSLSVDVLVGFLDVAGFPANYNPETDDLLFDKSGNGTFTASGGTFRLGGDAATYLVPLVSAETPEPATLSMGLVSASLICLRRVRSPLN